MEFILLITCGVLLLILVGEVHWIWHIAEQRDRYKRMAELMADYINTEVPKRRITSPFMMRKVPAWDYFYNLAKGK